MLLIMGLLLNVGGSTLLGYLTGVDFGLTLLIPMLMFNFVGVCIVHSNNKKI